MPKVGAIDVDFEPEALLDAISVVESGGGYNNHPRFEISYAPEGEQFTVQGRLFKGTGRNFNNVVRERWKKWGMRSACSYGPYQLMYHTAADLGFNGPPELLTNESVSVIWARKLMERIVARGARTVDEVADAWNSGSHRDGFVPTDYINKVRRAYGVVLGGTANGIQA